MRTRFWVFPYCALLSDTPYVRQSLQGKRLNPRSVRAHCLLRRAVRNHTRTSFKWTQICLAYQAGNSFLEPLGEYNNRVVSSPAECIRQCETRCLVR